VKFLATRNAEEFVSWKDAMATIAINTMHHETWRRHRQEGGSNQQQQQGRRRDGSMNKKTRDYDNHPGKPVLLSWQTLRRRGNDNDQACVVVLANIVTTRKRRRSGVHITTIASVAKSTIVRFIISFASAIHTFVTNATNVANVANVANVHEGNRFSLNRSTIV
jgi:hypothetical protein